MFRREAFGGWRRTPLHLERGRIMAYRDRPNPSPHLSPWTFRRGVTPPENTDSAGAATTRARSTLQQQVEDLERTLPMPGLRVLEVRIDDLERARKRHAQSATGGVKLGLGLLAELQIKRGVCDETIQDRPQFDGFVDFLEPVDVLLHPFG